MSSAGLCCEQLIVTNKRRCQGSLLRSCGKLGRDSSIRFYLQLQPRTFIHSSANPNSNGGHSSDGNISMTPLLDNQKCWCCDGTMKCPK